MPAEERQEEVCGTEDVETPTKYRSGDPVEAGAIPGDLRAVDGEVGGDGAVETLLLEDGVGGVCFEGGGRGVSARSGKPMD